MTEEEKAKWMEEQRLAEEKSKRDKEELLAQFLKVSIHLIYSVLK